MPPTVTDSAWVAMNPEALITAAVPTGPLVGLRPVTDGVVRPPDGKVGAAVAELVPSETTTAWVPAATLGIVKCTVALPLASVVPPEVIGAVMPPTVTVSAWVAMKPGR